MSKGKQTSRRTNTIVRKPATKFAHLRKRMQKIVKPAGPKTK